MIEVLLSLGTVVIAITANILGVIQFKKSQEAKKEIELKGHTAEEILTQSKEHGDFILKDEIGPSAFTYKEKEINESVDSIFNEEIDDRISKIENAISNIKQLMIDNPEAVISFAALKKDVELLEKNVNRLDNSIKWFLGIIVTLSLGILTLAFSVLLSK